MHFKVKRRQRTNMHVSFPHSGTLPVWAVRSDPTPTPAMIIASHRRIHCRNLGLYYRTTPTAVIPHRIIASHYRTAMLSRYAAALHIVRGRRRAAAPPVCNKLTCKLYVKSAVQVKCTLVRPMFDRSRSTSTFRLGRVEYSRSDFDRPSTRSEYRSI